MDEQKPESSDLDSLKAFLEEDFPELEWDL